MARANINHVGTGKNLVTYPIRGREIVNIVALTRASDWAEESWSAKASPSELAGIFGGWVDYVRDAIAAIAEDNLYRWGLFIREPLEHWVKGRVALLGDAAHPMLPYPAGVLHAPPARPNEPGIPGCLYAPALCRVPLTGRWVY